MAWEQAASRVMYCFTSNVNDQFLSNIGDAKMPKEAWTNLKKVLIACTTARKLQHRHELSNVWQKDMSMAAYIADIKEICDSLAAINVTVEEDEMVHACHGGMASKFGAFLTAVCARENTPSFFYLKSRLLVEENHVGASMITDADNKMLDTQEDRPRGRGGRGGSAHNGAE